MADFGSSIKLGSKSTCDHCTLSRLPGCSSQLQKCLLASAHPCASWRTLDRKSLPSGAFLSPLRFRVDQAAPVAPTFSLDPQQQVYRTRNYIKLLCSIPVSLDYVKEVPNYTDFGLAVSIPVSNLKNCNYDLQLMGDNSRALRVVPILCTNLLVPLAQREATCVHKHRHITRRARGHECNCKEQVLF